MTEIVAFLEIFILLTCAVYSVLRVATVITQKKPKEQEEQEEQSLCDSCAHLVRKGCDIDAGKYKCDIFIASFYKSPEFCRNYELRKEKNKPPKETSNEQN